MKYRQHHPRHHHPIAHKPGGKAHKSLLTISALHRVTLVAPMLLTLWLLVYWALQTP